MNELAMLFLETLKKQGISFFILGCIVFYFYSELKELKAEVKLCNDTIVSIYSTNNSDMKEVIIRNTEAFLRIENILKEK